MKGRKARGSAPGPRQRHSLWNPFLKEMGSGARGPSGVEGQSPSPSAMSRTKILIDCDPGYDDAVAILMAARHLDLIGITTCHGNSSVENVTRNALSVLALAGLDIPVAAGCAAPLLGPRPAHGGTGLDGADLPPPARAAIATHAIDFLIEQARAHQGELVLAVIGPATNAAVALAREPRLASWLREISVMGGSAGGGNATAVAEFNVWADPEAASVLFGCGAPIRMVGYDVTSRTGAGTAEIARLREGGRVARTIADLLDRVQRAATASRSRRCMMSARSSRMSRRT